MNRDEEVYAAVVGLPAGERAAFLDRACEGDPALRARVEALLVADKEADAFFTSTPAPRPALVPEEKPGDTIGRYKLLQKIGEGGCGVVYMAEQQEPVRRRVALKVIKLGMDTKEVIARFEAERQALAMMDHPNIAKVLDAGATKAGRPFFVMELVRGVPITKYCDGQNLPTRARLELFTQICHAVQHAHQKGIIHRDIKPSNVLVALHDTVAVPKLIDFGIAKATQGRLTDRTLFTALEQFIGTPTYMSPEQAQLSGLDIDTRSDIYSLGVLLYELLTGCTPFDAKDLLKAGLDEIRRQIREVEPPKPSMLLGTLKGEALTTTARFHQIAAPKLINFIKGDLDWIVMRCLEKDRARRYGTANALALDLQNFVRNEPVSARRPSPWYVLRKLARRRRGAVVGACAFLMTVVGGTAASVWLSTRADRAGMDSPNVRRIASEALFSVDALLIRHAGNPNIRPNLYYKKAGDLTVHDMLNWADQRFSGPFAGAGFESAELEVSTRDTLVLGYLALGDYAAALPHAERAYNAASQLTRDGKPAVAAQHEERRRQLLERLVQLYRRWDEAEPNTGKSALAATWQQRLDEHNRTNALSPATANGKP